MGLQGLVTCCLYLASLGHLEVLDGLLSSKPQTPDRKPQTKQQGLQYLRRLTRSDLRGLPYGISCSSTLRNARISLHPTPFTLLPIPYTLHPTPYTE